MQHLIRETRLWPLVEERAGLTPDALLVVSAEAAQDVKRIVDAIRDDGDDALL